MKKKYFSLPRRQKSFLEIQISIKINLTKLINFSTIMIYEYIVELSKDKQSGYKSKLPIKQLIERVNEKFLDKVYEWFLDKMFDMDSMRTREDFIKKMCGDDFKWLFNPQMVRDKVDQWIKENGPKTGEEETKSKKSRR